MSNDILVNQTLSILDQMDQQISETLNISKLLNNPIEMEKKLQEYQKIGKTNANELMSITKEEIEKNKMTWKQSLSPEAFSLLERIANAKEQLNETKQKIIDRIRISVNFGNRSYFLSPLIRVFDRLSDPNWLKNPNASEISGYMANFVLNITKNQLLNSLSDIPITGPVAANTITALDSFAAAPPIFAKMDEMLKKYGVGSVIPSAATQTSSIIKLYKTFRDLFAGNFSITTPSSSSQPPQEPTIPEPPTPSPPAIVIIKEKEKENENENQPQIQVNPPVETSLKEGGGGNKAADPQKRKKNNYNINLLESSSNQILSRIHKQIQTYFTFRQKQMQIKKHPYSYQPPISKKTQKRKYVHKRKQK